MMPFVAAGNNARVAGGIVMFLDPLLDFQDRSRSTV